MRQKKKLLGAVGMVADLKNLHHRLLLRGAIEDATTVLFAAKLLTPSTRKIKQLYARLPSKI